MMPHATNEGLPLSVRGRLPVDARHFPGRVQSRVGDLWQRTDRMQEIAHRVAWAAVKKRFHKVGERWEGRGG